MSGWTADFVNDPFDDYNLIVEILFNDEDVAVIKQGNNGLEMKWYASDKDLTIPVEWLNGLLNEAKERLNWELDPVSHRPKTATNNWLIGEFIRHPFPSKKKP